MKKALIGMEKVYNRIPQKLIDYLYLTAFLLVLVYDYAFLTRFDREPFRLLYMAGAALAGLVLILRCLNIKNENKIGLGLALAFLLIGGGYLLVRHSFYFFVLAMLMVGGLRVEDKKLFAVYLLAATVFFVVMFMDFLIKTPEWKSGRFIHFGSINTTDCQGMVFYIIVVFLFYKGEKVRYTDLLVLGAITLWFWWYTRAEINMYCSMGCLVLAGFRKCASALGIKRRHKSQQIVGYIMSLSFLLCAACMIYLAIQFDPDAENWRKLNLMLHRRLESSHDGFIKYPLCMWGTEYKQVGVGFEPGVIYSEMYAQYGYTFIDSSYPNILINHGYLVFAMILGVMSFVSFRYAKRGELYKVMFLAVIAIDCAAESHLKELSCNIWLLLPLAKLTSSADNALPEPMSLCEKNGLDQFASE